MEPPNRNPDVPPEDETSSPFQKRWRRRTAKVKETFELRDLWWRLLDEFEARHFLRWGAYVAAALAVVGVISWIWIYPSWAQNNGLKIGHQWIAAGRLDQAAKTARQMLEDSPDAPEAWQLAAEVARSENKPSEAVNYSRHAASLAPDKPEFTLAWAEDALLAGQPDVAEGALAGLPPDVVANSAHAQRLAGEIARRRIQLTVARAHFTAALRLDGPVAIDEVPLGSILIYSRDPAERRHGLAYLEKWAPDRDWGAAALRVLLGDAVDHDDHPAMLKWADALRAHPKCTLADIPNCLLAISKSDSAHFADVLAILEKKQAGGSSEIALLVGWLNQINRSAEAVQWLQSLPPALTKKPPAVVVAAEAYRRNADWTALSDWVSAGDWGREVDFIRYTYGMLAARRLGDTVRADELWQSLRSDAQATGGHALFAADTFYTWGWTDEAVSLWWLASDQPGVAWQALGTLARHYQTQRDATGLYKVFSRLHALRPQDDSIANNFALFAVLTGNDSTLIERLARENHARAPTNLGYRATYAFVLCVENRVDEALALLKPVASEWRKSSGLAFAEGLTLTAAGRKNEARPLLESLDSTTMTKREEELVRAALN